MIPDVAMVKKLQRIRLICLDVDGVLTDRGLYYGPTEEMKRFDVQDGHGIVLAQRAGLSFAIISGRESAAVTRRAEELGITEVHQGARDKLSILQESAKRRGLTAEEIMFVGDDLPDLPVILWCGASACPADAHPDVASRALFRTHAPGGRGAVREAVEFVLKAQDLWSAVLEAYLHR